jgi:hypothetical protein
MQATPVWKQHFDESYKENFDILLSLTEVQFSIDGILGEGAYVDILHSLAWNDYYKSWDRARDLARQGSESHAEFRNKLISLQDLGVALAEHLNIDIRGLAKFLMGQNY